MTAEPSTAEIFAANLAVTRKTRKLRVGDLAKVAHMSPSRLSDIEQRRRDPSADDIERLADALGVRTGELTNAMPAERPVIDRQPPADGKEMRARVWEELNTFRSAYVTASRTRGNDAEAVYAEAIKLIGSATVAMRELNEAGKFKARQ